MKKPTTKVTDGEIQNGVEDEFGVLYSKDGKRLLRCNNYFISEYTVKEGAEVICDLAFNSCYFLQYIYINDSVTTIGHKVLGRPLVTTIFLPSSLKYIYESAIECGFHLRYLIVPNGSKKRFKHLLHHKFWKYICTMDELCKNFPLYKPFSSFSPESLDGKILKDGWWCDIPDEVKKHYPTLTVSPGVEIIGNNTFSKTNYFETILLPDSVVEIQESAFYGCGMLKNIVLPKSLKKIGEYAFKNCKSLVELTIPASVEEIGTKAFEGCKNIKLKSESKRFVVKDGLLIDLVKHIILHCNRCVIYKVGGNNWSCGIWYAKHNHPTYGIILRD